MGRMPGKGQPWAGRNLVFFWPLWISCIHSFIHWSRVASACSSLKQDFGSWPETEVRPQKWECWILAPRSPGTVASNMALACQQHRNEFPHRQKVVKPGTSLVAHLPMPGTWVQSLVQEDPTSLGATEPMLQNYWACALEPRSHSCWARAPRSLSSATREPTQWGACVPQLEKARVQPQDPVPPKIENK